MHKRLFPKVHELHYRVFYLYCDLDHIDSLVASSALFSRNRFNLYSFYDRDHGARDGSSIRDWIENALRDKGMDHLIGGQITMLCYPRILGYVFNPLTLYYIHDGDGTVAAILHEVKNTFGEQHGYLLPVSRDERGLITQECDKVFHVSPFMDIEGRYDFTLNRPDERLLVHIDHSVDGRKKLIAKLTGDRREFSSGRLLMNLIRYPLMTLKVIFGIHYEALKLWWKKIPFFKKPPLPDRDIT